MSYQVLARKWRPARFQEMVGQEHVLKALVNALDDDRLHHAYLFTGTRGVGKTSIARLFAKSLNCETGVSSTPCGQCSACKEIAEGRFVDLIEVDAASRTKVEDTRELMENVQYAPTHGRYKVYLIDEVHMLSTHSFNALLKTLEEPPPHVKFLLATTDPQKLPITILSRCLQFNLKNLIPERIVSHLSHVLGEENISFEEPALWLLARSADGSMRDAMSLTDQAIAFGAGVINEADVRAMLGTIDQRLVYQMLYCLASGDAKGLMASVTDLAQFSPDYNTVLGDLISVLHRIALAQTIPDAVDNSMGDMLQVQELAKALTAEDIQLYYQVALMGRKDLPFVPDPREGLEMVLLRMLAFRPAGAKPRAVALQNSSALASNKVEPSRDSSPDIQTNEPVVDVAEAVSLDRSDSLPEAEPAIEQPIAPPALNPENDLRQDEPPAYYDEAEYAAPQSGVDPRKKFESEGVEQESTPPWSMDESEQSSVNDQAMQPLENEYAPSESKTDFKSLEIAKSSVAVEECSRDLGAIQLSDWVHIGRNLGLSGMTESLATHISLEEIRSDAVVLHYTKDQKTMLNEVQQQRISDALNTYFSAPVSVEFVQAIQTQETPAQYLNRKREERHSEAITSIRNDETVKQLQQHFDAQIELSSVQPID
ncbi:DNA polymerase III subunit gamma/tau [Neptuniibacter sp. 1_MG-2023]|uniref:DNA polymerase III subunit gamma/tau n=1 Tax=Neptuniibacter sp. 1_MG-2023 TaxID=3062662 RepID=UPI0026E3C63F|nr:DNA polymerase III subunit gamma/tau [Neptuniibacter sp. 1_MG-2023]MDO6593639.1 DNA polymerase III subunit gamma/tau [Neptuniibacter sp. 1_MG-2023]